MDAARSPGRSYGGMSSDERTRSRRRQLLQAANAIIAEGGVGAVSAESVCRRARLTKRYFYAEFTTKDDLLDACAEQLFGRLWTAMDEALRTSAPSDKLSAALRAVMDTLASDPAGARLYSESPAFPQLLARQNRAIREFSGRMAQDAMPFTGAAPEGIRRDLATRALVAGATELIVAWLQDAIDADEDTLIATLNAAALGAARACSSAG